MSSKEPQNTAAATAAATAASKEVATIGRSTGLVARMAMKFGIEQTTFLTTLKQTAFRQRGKSGAPAVEVSNEQMAMLLHIAEKYDLDPFVRELYAFPTDGGIAPIVPIDGWIAIINRHPAFESMTVETAPPGTDKDDYWTAVTIKRRDRKEPMRVEEWLKECYRDTDPWNSHPKRMLRHKAVIQCARYAFGFSGVFDPDEEERIFANAIDVTPRAEPTAKPTVKAPQRKSAAQSESVKSAPPREPDPERPSLAAISLDQSTSLADKLKEEGVALSLFLAKFEIGSLDDLPAAKYEEALKAIDALSA